MAGSMSAKLLPWFVTVVTRTRLALEVVTCTEFQTSNNPNK